ncbi:unnamed protein product, partial [marine sediment metagenome]
SNATAGAQSYDLAFDDTFDWCDEDLACLAIHMGLPQNPTRNFFGGPWRWNVRVNGSVGAPPASPIPGVGPPAWTLTEGQKVWFKAQILREDGRVSTPFECDPVVVVA